MEASPSFLWLEQCWLWFPGPILTQVTTLCLPQLVYTSGRLHGINEIPKPYWNANARLIAFPAIDILSVFFPIFLMISLCSWSNWRCGQSVSVGIKIIRMFNCVLFKTSGCVVDSQSHRSVAGDFHIETSFSCMWFLEIIFFPIILDRPRSSFEFFQQILRDKLFGQPSAVFHLNYSNLPHVEPLNWVS